MNKPNTKCRVCGKSYFCCSDSRKIGSWRTMACSTECFREYMERIGTSRNQMAKELNITEDNRNYNDADSSQFDDQAVG